VGEGSHQPVASVIAITTFWRDRYGEVEDPFGFGWAIATHLEDLSAAKIEAQRKKAGGHAPQA
jgi:hypothetical protein